MYLRRVPMTEASELRELEDKLKSLKDKKAQLDSEAMRHEMELSNAKESLESSLNELKGLGFNDLNSAQTFIDESVKELNTLLTAAQEKIEGITTA